MKIGCHAVLFRDRIATETEEVLKEFANTGCQGVEIGARFFGVDKSVYLKELLEKYHLELSGLHVSILWTDLVDHVDQVKDVVERAVEFLQIMPNRNIILTGMATANPSEFPEEVKDSRLSDIIEVKKMAIQLNEIAQAAREKGVYLNYHNHCWEFEEDALLFNSLIQYAPSVRFALDIGWAMVGGGSPVALISENPERFQYVHLRDYNSEALKGCHTFSEKQEGYVDLGMGDVDYRQLMETLKRCMKPDGWAVIEYEMGKVNFNRYANAVKYIREIL